MNIRTHIIPLKQKYQFCHPPPPEISPPAILDMWKEGENIVCNTHWADPSSQPCNPK